MAEENIEKIRHQLRSSILAARDEISFHDRQAKSAMIEKNLWQLAEISDAETLFIYVSFRSEVETISLIRHCLDKGKKVTVPLTLVDESRLQPYELQNPDEDLQPGYCGIYEPVAQRLTLLDPKAIDTVILPGSVFDAQGGRLGYGGGYYDRFLALDAPQARRVGIAFEQQVVDRVALEAHDMKLDVLVTEQRIIRIS